MPWRRWSLGLERGLSHGSRDRDPISYGIPLLASIRVEVTRWLKGEARGDTGLGFWGKFGVSQ